MDETPVVAIILVAMAIMGFVALGELQSQTPTFNINVGKDIKNINETIHNLNTSVPHNLTFNEVNLHEIRFYEAETLITNESMG